MHPTARFSSIQITELAESFESKSAQELVQWAIENFGDKVALASSFGAEDVALIDMMHKIAGSKIKVFTLDTGRLNQETYDVMDDIRAKYEIKIEAYFPDPTDVEQMVRERGMNLMYQNVENRKLCCEIRKVRPMARALAGLDAWITGIRRNQVSTRAVAKKIEVDSQHEGILKLNPIADWTSENVWDYLRANDVPYNALHDKGFPSIGCEPCTRAVEKDEDPRSGRWWWEESTQKECGLHFDPTGRLNNKKAAMPLDGRNNK
jgi:phosphoadenosine phosphosulfate reductase